MVKTVGLSDDAYERLATIKGEDESFSDVVRRLTGAHLLKSMAGTMDEETADHYREAIDKARAREDHTRRQRVSKLADADGEG